MCKWGTNTRLTVEGKSFFVDSCIAELVQKLNDVGLLTIASCCGHGKRPAIISLRDGREIIICKDFDEARALDKLWPPICGDFGGTMSDKEQELLPCPFCNGESIICKEPPYMVVCKIGCCTGFMSATPEGAVKIWNTRPATPVEWPEKDPYSSEWNDAIDACQAAVEKAKGQK